MQKSTHWSWAALATLGLAAATSAIAADNADRRLQTLYSSEWQWRQLQLPDSEDTQKPVQDHLPRVDAAAQAERLKYWQDVLRQLDAIPRAELSAPEQLN